MDPATAIGLVSGILSFVGAAEKILKLSWTLYNSAEGSSEETETRLKVAESMNVIGNRILPNNQPGLTEEDKALMALAQECSELTNDIRKELQSIKPRRRKSKTQSGVAALKSLMVEPKIKDLEKRLQHCRDQLHFHIATLSSENLKTLLATYKEDGAKLTQLELSVSQLRQTLQDTTAKKVDLISSQAIKQLQALICIGQNALNEVAQDRILRGIKAGFEDMSYRYQSVDRPFGETFEWVFNLNESSPEATKFMQWLSSGDGTFHICGKLGSGKSTLMKKLFDHKRSRAELEKWALSQPKIYSAYEILDDDIKQAYARLSNQSDGTSLSGYRFCFFIDGLDEYQVTTAADRREMMRCLTDLADNASGNFKVCVSSRIENPFMDMLLEDNRIYLHKWTEPDMKEYVEGNLNYIGTEEQRRHLASSITEKAEGIFLWVVLVVQNIRRQADDGARFSRLLGEIESLPVELNELFQRILDGLGAQDRRLMSCTVSLLRFVRGIPVAEKKRLWLSLSDFYFLEDYEADTKFAEDVQFLKPELETAEGNKKGRLDFTHRSVGDFFDQQKVRAETHDQSFNNLEALSQLKLANIQQYWWDVERRIGATNKEERQRQEKSLSDHSILATSLIHLRRKQQLDATPFHFLECLDSIPQLSVSNTVSRALASHKTAFHINLPLRPNYRNLPYYCFQISHVSRVRHNLLDSYGRSINGNDHGESEFDTENPTVPWRAADQDIDTIEDYSTAMVSPLFVELCSGRLEYPLWRISRMHDMPMEPEHLAMLAYYAIATVLSWGNWTSRRRGGDKVGLLAPGRSGLTFLQHLFEQKIVSPAQLTHLAYGGQCGFVRIAAGSQPLSIWQHFFCWWTTAVAVSGQFEPEMDSSYAIEMSPKNEQLHSHECTYNPSKQQWAPGMVLQTFITNDADLLLAIKIRNAKELEQSSEDLWIQSSLEITPNGGETLEVEVVVNLALRGGLGPEFCTAHPYGPPRCQEYEGLENCERMLQSLPKSSLSVGDWISRSRLPNKDSMLKSIEEKLGAVKLEDVQVSNPISRNGART